MMKLQHRLGISFVVALIVCVIFSWPLAKYTASGVPAAAANLEKNNTRYMIAGDHLQFLYHMWLAKDTFTGQTPLFYNLYEFNTGDDAERYEVRPYYLPFSFFFTIGTLIGGQAFGWNFTIVISFWLTYWFSWKLARRYHPDEWITAIIAILAISFPFGWIVLLGGSPTGFAMMWVPILLYGIDRWIADKSFRGASLTGAALFFAEWGDTHVFFFNALLTPFWCLFVFLYHYGWRLPGKAEWLGWIKSSAILLLFSGLVVFKAMGVNEGLQSTPIAKGRSLHEVSLFSHGLDGLIQLNRDGDGRKTYVGIYGLVLLACSLLFALTGIFKNKKSSRGWCLLFLLCVITGIFFLSTGVKNPFGPRAWQILMKVVPPYGMIRQPDKIFCILPALLLVAGTLAFSFTGRWSNKWIGRSIAFALLIPLYVDFQSRLNPTISLLDRQQGAYEAVADDARSRGEDPHAIIIPLWPGNSHFSSLYEYYVSLYRIRMVNGYRPTPRQIYLETIFEPFQSINSGFPSDDQLDNLIKRGVRYVILHEDAFPEKVSSFPVNATLANLLNHPRLNFLARDGAVWSFSIADNIETDAGARVSVPVLFPVRYWDWERNEVPAENVKQADDAVSGKYVELNDQLQSVLPGQLVRTAGNAPMEWHMRVRGQGSAELLMNVDDRSHREPFNVDTVDWKWIQFAVPEQPLNAFLQANVKWISGTLDMDVILLTRAGWRPMEEAESMVIPATCFFHAGHTLDDFSGVKLRKDYDPNDLIFYSRNLYLHPGRYLVSMEFESEAPSGTVLGSMVMRAAREGDEENNIPVKAQEPARLEYIHPDNRFFRFGFRFSREADMTIRSVTFTRMP